MTILLAFPVMIVLLMLQVGIFSQLPLLHGTADIILLAVIAWALHDRVRTAWIWALIAGLMVSAISAMPSYTPLVGYFLVVAVTRLLIQRVWQTPILVMFLMAFAGTLAQHLVSILALQISGTSISWSEALSLVIMPSALFNLVLALPVYIVIHDIAEWAYPIEVEA